MRKRRPFNELKPRTRMKRESEVKHLIAFAEAMDHDFHYPDLRNGTPAEKAVRTRLDILEHIRLARAAKMIPNELEHKIWCLEQRLQRELMYAHQDLKVERREA